MAPLFSVVIPTLNRAHLLPFALQSLFGQTFTDFEVIINDNCSDDRTGEVARQFADPRIRYFRNEARLPIAQNWSAGISHARGEYVIIVPDDDALAKVTLQRVAKAIEEHHPPMVVWKYCYYYEKDWVNVDYPKVHPFAQISANSLAVPYFSNQEFAVDSSKALAQMFKQINGYVPEFPSPVYFGRGPQLTNAVYRRSLLDGLKTKGIPLLTTYASDVYSGVVTICEAGQYYYLDSPLTVCRIAEDSASIALASRGQAMASYFDKFPDEKRMEHVPLKFWSNSNNFVEMLLRAKAALGTDASGIEIDWVQYYLKCHAELARLSRRGVDVSDELNEFENTLSSEAPAVKSEVRAALKTGQDSRLRFMARSMLLRSKVAMRLSSKFKPGLKVNRQIAIQGDDGGFQDISSCAKLLDAKFLEALATFWVEPSGMSPTIGRLI
jgi:glycosyltransferase involved in cell wall biosynthesis